MSTVDDDYSDVSFDGSASSSAKDEPPTLDETLFDMSLFKLFMAYMKSHQGIPNLNFLKQVRLLRIFNARRDVWVSQAIKLIWTFVAETAPMPITCSEEVKKKLINMSWDPDAELTLDKDSFSVAFGEVYNTVVPHFRNWISTEEWREAVPFQHIAPPTFSVVLASSTLRVLFNKFLKSQLGSDSDGTASRIYHLWKFCIIANDFRDGKYNHSAHIEGKKKKGEADGGDGDKSEKSEKSEKPEDGGKINPEEYAKRLYKKYKHQVSLPYDGSIPYAVYIIRALDHAIEEFDRSTLFAKWVGLKQYQGVDYQAKIVHQTLDADGYVEPPTCAGSICSSMLPFILILLSGTEKGLNLQFMVDVLKFHRTYANFEKSEKSTTASSSVHESQTQSSTETESSRKDMVEEARRIYAKFLESGEMYCDPRLVEEVRAALSKSGGKGVTPSMFRKCGAFIYQHSEHSWGRETRATIGWTNKSYDNRGRAARAVEEEFSMKVLPEGIDLQLVPNIDDVLNCPELAQDFGEFCGKQVAVAFADWQKAYAEYFQAPINHRRPILLRLVDAFAECVACYPHLQPIQDLFEREVKKRERVSDSVLVYYTAAGIRATAQKYLLRWLVEHSMKWKTAQWTPVQNIVFSDLTLTYGMGTVERTIEEEALKGKSGLSKYLAKRQVKKQSVSHVRTSPAKDLGGLSKTVFATGSAMDMMKFGKDFGKSGGATDTDAIAADRFVITVPSLADTLSAPFMRNFFENSYLISVLSASEIPLWQDLNTFFCKYSTMSSEDVMEAQNEMRKEAERICTKYETILKNVSQIRERLAKQKVIFPQFFRSYEMELYAEVHSQFEKVLQESGWKSS